MTLSSSIKIPRISISSNFQRKKLKKNIWKICWIDPLKIYRLKIKYPTNLFFYSIVTEIWILDRIPKYISNFRGDIIPIFQDIYSQFSRIYISNFPGEIYFQFSRIYTSNFPGYALRFQFSKTYTFPIFQEICITIPRYISNFPGHIFPIFQDIYFQFSRRYNSNFPRHIYYNSKIYFQFSRICITFPIFQDIHFQFSRRYVL